MFQMWPRVTALRDKAESENGEGFEAAIPLFPDFGNCDECFLASYLLC